MTTRIGAHPSGVYGRGFLQPQRFAPRKADGASAMEDQVKILRHTGVPWLLSPGASETAASPNKQLLLAAFIA